MRRTVCQRTCGPRQTAVLVEVSAAASSLSLSTMISRPQRRSGRSCSGPIVPGPPLRAWRPLGTTDESQGSASRNSTWRMHASDRLLLLDRQLELAQSAPPLDPEQVRQRRTRHQPRTSTAWISFLARERARTSCSRRAKRRRNLGVHSSGDQTASSSPAASSLASVRASNLSVFARACRIPVSAGLTTTTRPTCGSRTRAISHALPVTSSATRSPRPRLDPNSSSRSGVVAIRPAERTAPLSTIATSQKSRCTSNPIALTSSSSTSLNKWRTSGRTTTTDTCSQHTRASRRANTEKPELEAHRPKRPAQLRSPTSGLADPGVVERATLPVDRDASGS
jgi:hypothetical protein